MKRKDIDHFSTSGDTKASVIERFQSYLETTHVPLLYRQEHVEVRDGVERLGLGLQSLVPPQHQDGAGASDRAERGASVEELVRSAPGWETDSP